MDEFELIMAEVTFDLLDLQMLRILDNALENCALGSRFGFLIGSVKESARKRLEVPHDML